MLSFEGREHRFCDGIGRREFLQIGGVAACGLTLADLLRSEAAAEKTGSTPSKKSIINIYLGGGPTHMDTFDLKPNAPKEYRGEFSPIKTKSPGLEICELMPELAAVGDKFSVIRSTDGMRNEHSSTQSDSGWSNRALRQLGGRPGIGPVMSKILGPAQTTKHGTAPTAVDLTGWTRPGFLGSVNSAFRPDGTGRNNLRLTGRMTSQRLAERQSLLGALDTMRREVDAGGQMEAMDSFTQRAVGIITSGKVYEALDYAKEKPEVLSKYGAERSNRYRSTAGHFLTARRLVESGVRSVSFSMGGWDTHGQNFNAMRRLLPPLSKAMAALISDLTERGMINDTIIMMSGEFGRTPRINGNAGRDHWPRAAFFFLGGGGMKHGQAIGATDAKGMAPADRPVHLQHIFHTVYHLLGIDADTVTLKDPNGRPQYLLDHREIIRELV